jgi:predicted dehydrogenase
MSEKPAPQKTPLRAAFIGGSLQSAVGYAHYAATRMDGRFTIAAGCFSRNAEINAATGRDYGVPSRRVHDDWRALLKQEAKYIDTMIVLTPTPTHAEIVSECLEAGVPVICEKALATTSDEAADLLNLTTKLRGFLAVTFNYSGYPMMRELRALIQSGALGRITQIHAEMPQEGFARRNGGKPAASPQAWRLEDGRVPTLHLDLAAHLHHLVYYATGLKPLEVSALQDNFGCFDGVADNVIAAVRYEQGAAANFWFSKSALGHRNGLRLRIYGERASVEWFQAEPETLHINHADGRREIRDRGALTNVASEARYTRFKSGHPAGYVEAFANLYADIADAVLAHKAGQPFTSREVFGAELALEGLHFMEAMADAAKSRSVRRVLGQNFQAPQKARAAA